MILFFGATWGYAKFFFFFFKNALATGDRSWQQSATMSSEPTRATQGISFELPLLKAAKERAASKRMSLSAYINQLIFDDLNADEALGSSDDQAGIGAGRIGKDDPSL